MALGLSFPPVLFATPLIMSSSEGAEDEEASPRSSQRRVYVGLIQANAHWE